jgi:hypothetical protein
MNYFSLIAIFAWLSFMATVIRRDERIREMTMPIQHAKEEQRQLRAHDPVADHKPRNTRPPTNVTLAPTSSTVENATITTQTPVKVPNPARTIPHPAKEPRGPPPKTPPPQPTSQPSPTPPALLTKLAGAIGTGDMEDCPNADNIVFSDDLSTPQGQASAHVLAAQMAGVNLSTNSKLVQRYALAVLYYSTGGANWKNKNKWLSTADPCNNWYGVVCISGSKSVVNELTLGTNNLVGNLPCELILLSSNHPSGAGLLLLLEVDNNSNLNTAPGSNAQYLRGLGSGLGTFVRFGTWHFY